MHVRWRYGSVMTTESLLRQGARRLGIDLDQDSVSRLSLYCDELERWNRRINLVARRTGRQEMLEKHFLDSLTLLPLLDRRGAGLLDVGSGAGFPGLVLAAAAPDLQVTLVEPRQKRVVFLRHVVRTLELANVRIVDRRLEEADLLQEGGFSHVTGRAVAEPGLFLAMVAPLLTARTRVILMLGGGGRDRLPERGIPGFRLLEEQGLVLPFSGAARHLVVVAPA